MKKIEFYRMKETRVDSDRNDKTKARINSYFEKTTKTNLGQIFGVLKSKTGIESDQETGFSFLRSPFRRFPKTSG
jgi:hypothetical protein